MSTEYRSATQLAIAKAARLIAQADGLLITAGAGMGVDSGLPDFRGTHGFWRAYPALAEAGLAFESIASPAAFRQDATLAWGFYGHRLALYRQTVPHAGFQLLKCWSNHMSQGHFVFTSNVDGQFQTAGFDDARIVECHGSIHHLQCSRPCSDAIWPADAFAPDVDQRACRLLNAPPYCPRCGALARPNVLMFGDGDWIDHRTERQHAKLGHWLASIERLVVIELGAGTAIPSVRMMSQRAAQQRDGWLIRINPRESEVSGIHSMGIADGALAALTATDLALADLGA